MSSRPDWFLRALLRLFPPAFRARHGAALEADVRRSLADGTSHAGSLRIVLDLLRTLPLAWAAAVTDGTHGITAFVRAGVTGDATLAVRGLGRAPGAAAVAMLTLALALGGNAAVFAVTRAVLLRSLPYDAPERIVAVAPPPVSLSIREGSVLFEASPVLEGARSVERSALVMADAAANLQAPDGALHVSITHVSDGFLDVLGIAPVIGSRDGADGALLAHAFWRSTFGADPTVVGRTIDLSGHRYRIAGVMPPEVEYPAGTDLWLPFPHVIEFFGMAAGPSVLVRLAPDVSLEFAAAELRDRTLAAAAERGDAPTPDRLPVITPLRDELTGTVAMPLLVLSVASALVLLLGCVNVAGVSLSRLAARSDELAIRAALGSGRARLFRLLLVDGAVPALLGGLGAALVALAATPVLVSLLPPELPGLTAARLDGPVIIFLAGTTALAALLVGGLVAFEGAFHPASGRLAVSRHGTPRLLRLQAGLGVAEVALAVLLAVTAALLARNLAGLRGLPLGFDVEHVLTFETRLPDHSHPDAASWRVFADDVQRRLASRSGVAAVGVSGRLPLGEGMGRALRIWREDAGADTLVVTTHAVSPDYFDAMGVRLLAGRPFGASDDGSTAILGADAARRLFGTAAEAVGARIRVRRVPDEASLVTVIGVADEVRQSSLHGQQASQLYDPWSVSPAPWPGFAVRAQQGTDPAALAAAVRAVVAGVHPGVAPFAVRTVAQATGRLMAADRALALLSTAFGGFALALAALGVYGVLAQGVAARRRELGVRLALGARRGTVVWSVLRRALSMTSFGTALGLFAALAAGRIIETLLHGISARDPVTLVLVPAATCALALAAALPAATRAAATDPMRSLRPD